MLPAVTPIETFNFGYVATLPSQGLFLTASQGTGGGVQAHLSRTFGANCIFTDFQKRAVETVASSLELEWRRYYFDKRLNGQTLVAVTPGGGFFDLVAGEKSITLTSSCILDAYERTAPHGEVAEGILFTLEPFTKLRSQVDLVSKAIEVYVDYEFLDRNSECIERFPLKKEKSYLESLMKMVEAYPNSDLILDDSPAGAPNISNPIFPGKP